MFDTEISEASLRYGVPESWIKAVIEVESSWNPQAFRAEPQIQDASWGLMQILDRTARGLGFAGDPLTLFDPGINIDLGAKLLGQLRSRYGDDFRRIYSAYNSGRADLWETSSQVAANVGRALAALEKYVTEDIEWITGMTPGTIEPRTRTMGAGVMALLFLVLAWAWLGKRK